MYPEIFGIIKSYGLLLAISFALGLWLSIRRGKVHGIPSEDIIDLVFGVLVSSIIGVRFFYVITHLAEMHPWYQAFFIWDGGLTLYGGVILATFTVLFMAHRRKIPFLVMADIFAPGVILGIGLTRIGCFCAGCCFGLPTDHSCGVVFPVDAPASRQFGLLPVHPAQLYASAAGFLQFAILLVVEKVVRFRGSTFGLFMVMYGIARFVLDFFRYYQPEQVLALGWTNNQWISLGFVAAGCVVLVMGWSRRDRKEAASG